jgi:hypothetical protein
VVELDARSGHGVDAIGEGGPVRSNECSRRS